MSYMANEDCIHKNSTQQSCCLSHFLQDVSPFFPLLFCQTIQDAVGQFDFTDRNAKVRDKMLYKGTSYRKGQFLGTWSMDYTEVK